MDTDETKTEIFDHSHINFLEYKGDHAAISGIGILHGLASNDELLLLLTLTLGFSSFLNIFFGLTIFTIGVVIGMIIFSTIIKLPFNSIAREKIIKWVNISIAILTLMYGIYSLLGGETINFLSSLENNLQGGLFSIAFILGIKHSMDADHIVAISSIILRSPSLKNSITLSISWALGHMLTASIITFILFGLKETVLELVLSNFEVIVGFMLIVIALLTLAWEFDIISWGKHSHGHAHEDGTIHSH